MNFIIYPDNLNVEESGVNEFDKILEEELIHRGIDFNTRRIVNTLRRFQINEKYKLNRGINNSDIYEDEKMGLKQSRPTQKEIEKSILPVDSNDLLVSIKEVCSAGSSKDILNGELTPPRNKNIGLSNILMKKHADIKSDKLHDEFILKSLFEPSIIDKHRRNEHDIYCKIKCNSAELRKNMNTSLFMNILSSTKWECPICTDEDKPYMIVTGCAHLYCHECITDLINKDKSDDIHFTCSICMRVCSRYDISLIEP